jgi:sortase A
MRRLEYMLCTLGFLLLSIYVGASGWSEWERRDGLAAFMQASDAAQRVEAPAPLAVAAPPAAVAQPAQPAPPATRAAPAARAVLADGTVAVLRIPAINLEVPVRQGTQGSVLLRGAGLVEGSPPPGSNGNIAIAAHRDSFFRGLREVAVGDPILLVTLESTRTYRVTELSVVRPQDVGVLAEIGAPAITLVTCFPFHFVGRAPQRYIVRAVADATST